MKLWKKVLAMVLSALLLLTALPVSTFAIEVNGADSALIKDETVRTGADGKAVLSVGPDELIDLLSSSSATELKNKLLELVTLTGDLSTLKSLLLDRRAGGDTPADYGDATLIKDLLEILQVESLVDTIAGDKESIAALVKALGGTDGVLSIVNIEDILDELDSEKIADIVSGILDSVDSDKYDDLVDAIGTDVLADALVKAAVVALEGFADHIDMTAFSTDSIKAIIQTQGWDLDTLESFLRSGKSLSDLAGNAFVGNVYAALTSAEGLLKNDGVGKVALADLLTDFSGEVDQTILRNTIKNIVIADNAVALDLKDVLDTLNVDLLDYIESDSVNISGLLGNAEFKAKLIDQLDSKINSDPAHQYNGQDLLTAEGQAWMIANGKIDPLTLAVTIDDAAIAQFSAHPEYYVKSVMITAVKDTVARADFPTGVSTLLSYVTINYDGIFADNGVKAYFSDLTKIIDLVGVGTLIDNLPSNWAKNHFNYEAALAINSVRDLLLANVDWNKATDAAYVDLNEIIDALLDAGVNLDSLLADGKTLADAVDVEWLIGQIKTEVATPDHGKTYSDYININAIYGALDSDKYQALLNLLNVDDRNELILDLVGMADASVLADAILQDAGNVAAVFRVLTDDQIREIGKQAFFALLGQVTKVQINGYTVAEQNAEDHSLHVDLQTLMTVIAMEIPTFEDLSQVQNGDKIVSFSVYITYETQKHEVKNKDYLFEFELTGGAARVRQVAELLAKYISVYYDGSMVRVSVNMPEKATDLYRFLLEYGKDSENINALREKVLAMECLTGSDLLRAIADVPLSEIVAALKDVDIDTIYTRVIRASILQRAIEKVAGKLNSTTVNRLIDELNEDPTLDELFDKAVGKLDQATISQIAAKLSGIIKVDVMRILEKVAVTADTNTYAQKLLNKIESYPQLKKYIPDDFSFADLLAENADKTPVEALSDFIAARTTKDLEAYLENHTVEELYQKGLDAVNARFSGLYNRVLAALINIADGGTFENPILKRIRDLIPTRLLNAFLNNSLDKTYQGNGAFGATLSSGLTLNTNKITDRIVSWVANRFGLTETEQTMLNSLLPEGSITLVPSFKVSFKNLYQVTYHDSDGKTVSVFLPGGTDPAVLTAKPVEGKFFLGWSDSEDGAILHAVSTDKSDLYPIYTESAHTVTFRTPDGDITATVEHGKTLDAIPAAVARTGYTAAYRLGASDMTEEAILAAPVTADVVYTVTYTKIAYTVTYLFWNGTEYVPAGSESVLYGDAAANVPTDLEVPAGIDPSKATLCFYQADGTTATSKDAIESAPVTGDVTYVLKYEENKVAVTYYYYDGTYLGTEYVNVGGTPSAIPTPAIPGGMYEGHCTLHYYADSACTEEIDPFNTSVNADTSYYLKYVAETYTVTFTGTKPDSTAFSVAVTYNYNELLSSKFPAELKVTGYTEHFTDGAVTANAEVAVTYTINQYTVTFTGTKPDSTAFSVAVTYDYNELLSSKFPAELKVTGYTEHYTDGAVTANAEVAVTYTINQYTVTFTGTKPDSTAFSVAVTYDYNETLSSKFPAELKVTGYTEHYTDGVVTANAEVAVTYTINQYTVTFTGTKPDSTAFSVAVTYNYNETLSSKFPAELKVTGYTEHFTDGAVTANAEVAVTYTINQYNVTFHLPDASVQVVKVNYNAKVPEDKIPVQSGYTGYYNGGSFDDIKNTVVTANVDYTVVFKKNHTVTFRYDSGTGLSVYSSLMVIDGNKIPALPADPAAPALPVIVAYFKGNTAAAVTAANKISGADILAAEIHADTDYIIAFIADPSRIADNSGAATLVQVSSDATGKNWTVTVSGATDDDLDVTLDIAAITGTDSVTVTNGKTTVTLDSTLIDAIEASGKTKVTVSTEKTTAPGGTAVKVGDFATTSTEVYKLDLTYDDDSKVEGTAKVTVTPTATVIPAGDGSQHTTAYIINPVDGSVISKAADVAVSANGTVTATVSTGATVVILNEYRFAASFKDGAGKPVDGTMKVGDGDGITVPAEGIWVPAGATVTKINPSIGDAAVSNTITRLYYVDSQNTEQKVSLGGSIGNVQAPITVCVIVEKIVFGEAYRMPDGTVFSTYDEAAAWLEAHPIAGYDYVKGSDGKYVFENDGLSVQATVYRTPKLVEKIYTVIFRAGNGIADIAVNFTVSDVTYATFLEPAVPAIEGKTGEWNAYDLNKIISGEAENIVSATYTNRSYVITYADGTTGTVTMGEAINVLGDYKPAEGKEIAEVKAIRSNGEQIEVTKGADGTYSMTVPASDVRIVVTERGVTATVTKTNPDGTTTEITASIGDPVTVEVTLAQGESLTDIPEGWSLVATRTEKNDKGETVRVLTFATILDEETADFDAKISRTSHGTSKLENGVVDETGKPVTGDKNVVFKDYVQGAEFLTDTYSFATYENTSRTSMTWLWILLAVLAVIILIALLYMAYIRGSMKPNFFLRFIVFLVNIFFAICMAFAAVFVGIRRLFGGKR